MPQQENVLCYNRSMPLAKPVLKRLDHLKKRTDALKREIESHRKMAELLELQGHKVKAGKEWQAHIQKMDALNGILSEMAIIAIDNKLLPRLPAKRKTN